MLNLDCATDERLQRVLKALREAAWRMLDRPEANPPCALKQRAVRQLSDYVSDTLSAREARKAGLIVSAQFHEKRADLTYERMPVRLRW
jgi:hypothetical protein